MLMTKRKPATVGEVLVEEFMEPMGLTQQALADAMGVQRKHVNQLCRGRRSVTAPTALILARIREQSRVLAERAAALRPVEGDELARRTRARRARAPYPRCRMTLPALPRWRPSMTDAGEGWQGPGWVEYF
jgi:addiction module HigA family antidote